MTSGIYYRLLCLLPLCVSAMPGMAGTSSTGTGLTMESRISAGGGPAVVGTYEMVNIITGPASPTATSGTGGEATPFSPELYALPVTISHFTIE